MSRIFFDTVVKNVWSIDSYLSSALAYQRFAKYQFREPSPQCWVMKGNSYQAFVSPLVKKLGSLNVQLNLNTELKGVTVRNGRVTAITCNDLKTKEEIDRNVDALIIAIPPANLGEAIFATASPDKKDSSASTIVSKLPSLANVRRLSSDPLPVLYVTFKRKIPDIPSYYVALLDSKYSLTFVKIEELSGAASTVLAVAASDFDALPIRLRKELAVEFDGRMRILSDALKQEIKGAADPILRELQRYVPFKIDSDIDWDSTFFHPNLDQRLFLNEVGSQHFCTDVSYPEVNNLFFAGNACTNFISIATVESGVCSGLGAARAIERWRFGSSTIEIIQPERYPTLSLFVWKIILAPHAALAKVWVEMSAIAKAPSTKEHLPGARAATESGRIVESIISDWLRMVAVLFRKR